MKLYETLWIVVFRDEKSKKEKVQIKTQNEKIVETDMDILYYTYKQLLE